jgi:hypothetical protein
MLNANAGLRSAERAIRENEERDQSRRRRDHEARAGIRAVDQLLEIIEERHLDGADVAIGVQPQWRRLLRDSGVAIPRNVVESPTTLVLHERLLDWQARLFERFLSDTSDTEVQQLAG